jgi:hypothetical protein
MTKDHLRTEGVEDALDSALIDQPESQESKLRHCKLSSALSTPSTRSSIMAMEQQANGDTLSDNHVTLHESHGLSEREAQEHSKRTLS